MQIEEVQCYYVRKMVVIDCIELKKKLVQHLRQLKKMIFERVDENMRGRNCEVLVLIQSHIQVLNRSIGSTGEYVSLVQDIEKIKLQDLPSIKLTIELNCRDSMLMFAIPGFTANAEVMHSTYLCRHSYH